MSRKPRRLGFESNNREMELFLRAWRTTENGQTFSVLCDRIGSLHNKRLINKLQAKLLITMALAYSSVEARRFLQTKPEHVYHTHGLYSAWVAASIVDNHARDFVRAWRREDQRTQLWFKTMRQDVFNLLAATMLHDFQGTQTVAATANTSELEAFLTHFRITKQQKRKIKRLATYTHHTDPESTQFADYKPPEPVFGKTAHLQTREVPLLGLLVMVADWSQIGSHDYLAMIAPIRRKVQLGPGIPLGVVELTTRAIQALGDRLEIFPAYQIIPEAIQDNLLQHLIDPRGYYWVPGRQKSQTVMMDMTAKIAFANAVLDHLKINDT